MLFLTKQEKYVIIFLVIGAICGTGYSYYKRFYPPINLRFPREKKDVLSKNFDNLLKEAKSVDINTASMEELMKLKGVGPVLAHRIIEYRTERGPFKEKDELKKVSGIGPKKFDSMRDYVIIE